VVHFHADGHVTGLDAVKQYSVLVDLTEGLEDRDIVFLYTDDLDWGTHAYHFKHDGDELLLYPMRATEEPYVFEMQEMKYRMRAQR